MRRVSLLVVVCVFLVLSSAFAQTSPTVLIITGRVLDPSRAPIAGARLTASPNVRGTVAATVTDQRGEFRLELAPGDYTLVVSADGFAPASQSISTVTPPPATLEFVLSLSTVQERVDVASTAGYDTRWIGSATRTPTPLRDVPQSVTVVTNEIVKDQLMASMADVVRYVPGITAHQGENNRDDVVIRGNRSSADFFVNGVRDDVAYFRDLYNLDRVEALKGPNAMIFGRGGGGGVINRVVKEPLFGPLHAFAVQYGAYDNRRATADFNQRVGTAVAIRVNGMFEDSGSFRDAVDLERRGLNPTFTVASRRGTRLTLGYEYLHDVRVADRGITSVNNLPADVGVSTYYGDPDQSRVRAQVNIGTVALEQQIGSALLRNRTVVAGYERFYQNFVPGAVTPDQRFVALTAYNNATDRTNVFNQTDLVYRAQIGSISHTLLSGLEIGHQVTDNFRNTGFFNNSVTSIAVPFENPRVSTPVTFRQNATDADNHVRASVAAAFVQDQVELSRRVQVLGGVRVDRFDLQYYNNRNSETLSRVDDLVSPRVGVVFKPGAAVSIYSSYSVSFLPSSGDQFSALTTVTQQMKPERFNNYEFGVKWDVQPALSLSTAVYRLDRTNTRATDPNDVSRIVQTGSQLTNGVELGISGEITPAWRIAGGYAYQDAFITSATSAAPQGAHVGQVPHHTFSLWNTYQVHRRVGVGLGFLNRSDMFATFSNTVTLPGYLRVDGAGYFRITDDLRLQANIENVFDKRYYLNADSNTNISPGSPRALRVALTAAF
jgi:catecholate siderophore receptor